MESLEPKGESITPEEVGFVPAGNMTIKEILRLVPDWIDQGIECRIGQPQPTEALTSEEMGAMGLVGVELFKPASVKDTETDRS